MKIINPEAAIQDEVDNIFTMRQFDYDNILTEVQKIVKPVEEIGFQINEISLKASRFSSGELAKTIKEKINIKIQKGHNEIDLSVFIPKLIENNYVYINGRQKIPIFQIFDTPIVTRGESIKFRTNVAVLMLSKDKESPHIQLSFMGKKIPLALIMIGYYGIDFVKEKFNLDCDLATKPENLFEYLRQDLKIYIEESESYKEEDFIVEIGRYYTKYNTKSKGEDILYALDLIPKVDVITAKFLKNDLILEEICDILKEEEIDDALITNKRIRVYEYIVLSKISKIIFDLCYTNRSARNPKFNINSTQILSDCNVSEVVQFNFAINPIEELTKLSRISILGEGGFKRENAPKHLRDINDSMFGRICPVDTPDRDNCGILESLVPNVHLDENWQFTDQVRDKSPISIPVSMTPFLKHDDQTRLQMACSQMRQAIMLRNFDRPLVSSGAEGLYTQYTQFIKIAKKDGEVIYIDKKYIIVAYNDKKIELFNISYRPIYIEHIDFMNIYVKVGDKFKKGEILAESNFCKNGNINIGKNLLTGLMIHSGHNYEDSIVISDRLVESDILTSVHFENLSFNIPPNKILLSLKEDEYKPLPDELETLEAGSPYAIIKNLNSDNFYSVFSDKRILESPKKFLIAEVNLYGNEWNEDIPSYKEWVEKRLSKQQDDAKNIQSILNKIMDKKEAQTIIRDHEIDKFEYTGKYKFKREKIEGINIEMFGIHFRRIQVGDKMANRHGNKGTISRIIPHNKMPQLPDGRHFDICINPLGVISRLNIGQLYELHLGMATNRVIIEANKLIDENKNQKIIKKYLLGFIKIVDQTTDRWYYKQFKAQLPKVITKEFMEDFSVIQAPFQSCKLEHIAEALKYTKTQYEYKIYEPISKTYITNPIAVGFLYFFRMVHIAEEKLAARGIGIYSRRTLQPLGGKKNTGGQRLGEMESACLLGHDAPINLHEFLTTKSDCTDLKNEYIRKFIDSSMIDEIENIDTVPETVKLLNSYLTVLGVDLN